MNHTRFVGIDPATKTGFVALDIDGEVLKDKELTGTKGGSSAQKIRTAHDEILLHLHTADVVAIEFFALDGQDTNRIASGYNWASRLAVDRVCTDDFISPEPIRLKQFVNVSEWEGEKKTKANPKGKTRIKGDALKEKVRESVTAHWGYYHDSYNVIDAYVLAQIARAVWHVKNGLHTYDDYHEYQRDILFAYVEPEKYAAMKKAEKAEEKRRKKEREAAKIGITAKPRSKKNPIIEGNIVLYEQNLI